MHTPGGGGWGRSTESDDILVYNYPTHDGHRKCIGRGDIFFPPKQPVAVKYMWHCNLHHYNDKYYWKFVKKTFFIEITF